MRFLVAYLEYFKFKNGHLVFEIAVQCVHMSLLKKDKIPDILIEQILTPYLPRTILGCPNIYRVIGRYPIYLIWQA